MKVRIVICLAAAIALVVAAGTRASAGEPSQRALDEMGLGGMSVMSDSDALAVRGMGYHSKKGVAKAWGQSWAQVSSHGAQAGSKNGYFSEGKNYASGKNLSYAGKIIVSGHIGGGGGPAAANYGDGGHSGGGVKVKAVVVFAGGSSSAKNH
jgi:hypothetical protein